MGSACLCKCNMLDCWFLYICFLLLSLTECLQLTLLDSSQLENWKILLVLWDFLCFRVTWQLIYIIIYTYSVNLLYFVLSSILLLLSIPLLLMVVKSTNCTLLPPIRMDSFKLFTHCCGDSKNNSDLEG